MVVFKKEGSVLDRLLSRYLWAELILGAIVIVVGLWMGGNSLFAVGACMMGFAAQCAAHARKNYTAAVGLGVLSVLVLTLGCVRAFTFLVSTSGYDKQSSPLSVLLVLAVIFLLHSFLGLPVEDREDLVMVRHGVKVLSVFSALMLGAIVLNYLLSYVFRDMFLTGLLDREEILASGGIPAAELQDFHYLEGVVVLAVCMTAIRAVVRAFFGKEPLEEPEKEIVE
ncbi:MAG: hypothetical protein J6C26_08845 [Clostridia bacterium]|nr:hypothetical protein [Clostridia bacterium]MBQ4322657.1 hypothetical protein [Clostridia bacterium]